MLGTLLSIGDEVMLVNVENRWTIGPSNPLINTAYECTGIITGGNHSGFDVQWDNGHSNGAYTDTHLQPTHESLTQNKLLIPSNKTMRGTHKANNTRNFKIVRKNH